MIPMAAPAARVGFPGMRSGGITRDSGKAEAVSKCRLAARSRAWRRWRQPDAPPAASRRGAELRGCVRRRM